MRISITTNDNSLKSGLFTTNINQDTKKKRKNHSTTTLLMKLYGDIKIFMNNSEITIAIFADYSKAFDTIDFYTLSQKMHTFNFSKDFCKYYTLDNELFNFSTAFCIN